MDVRTLAENDWQQYKDLRLLSLGQSPQSFASSVEDEITHSDEHWRARVRPSQSAFILGAFDGVSLVAIAGFSQGEKAKICHKAKLWGIYVKSDYRGQGIAADLLNASFYRAFERPDIAQLQLSVVVDNTHAIALYERAGFTSYAIEADAIRAEGQSYDEMHMVKKIRD
ncbi:GNAT family N-acetyltransferase [Vibrio ostreicida]|uniref:GNAT family N-acetyltransferase n=1 Tax=Vibrio ostreicida TaxID=526588 RepID=A0ABT8C1M5_9VIBR|nr:N-acetyltransferase [Vibrio ostreicida]MDN3612516.1 GNAT family N-acetyltransferase [Vibrio ostreicida]NPD09141.1 GNAT family N-acetyltransferase [Vibrio ostreicida]